ncbi:MAG: hypothetical protein VYB51_05295 [Gemmatimonadota bacterium]|nr:hypothetical protein [Gemmatimonadota bacterium]
MSAPGRGECPYARDLRVQRSTLGWQALFLLGNPAYYSRFGFELSAPHGIRSKYSDEHFQLKELVAGSLDGVEGEFVYPEAFEAGGW